MSVISLLLAAFNGVAAFVTFAMENPRDQYYEKIPVVKQNRLADVTNALGPIVSDVSEFMREGESGSVEELTEENQATVAIADSISPSDDLSPLRDALSDYYRPPKIYRRCRRSRDGCYIFFIVGLIFAIFPIGIGLLESNPSWQQTLISFSYLIATLGLAVGFISFGSFMYHRNKLDGMTEDADFQLD